MFRTWGKKINTKNPCGYVKIREQGIFAILIQQFLFKFEPKYTQAIPLSEKVISFRNPPTKKEQNPLRLHRRRNWHNLVIFLSFNTRKVSYGYVDLFQMAKNNIQINNHFNNRTVARWKHDNILPCFVVP